MKEWISTLFGLRAKNLEKGIKTLIGADYASKLYKHPLVSTMATGKKLPSYIGSGTFASALVDLLAHGEEDQPTVETEDKAAQVVHNASGDPVLGRALRALSSAGAQTVADIRTEIAAWFDDGMNRVSGWYRRQTQLIILIIGALVTLFANASTVHVARDLWHDDALRYSIAQEAVSIGSTTQSTESLQAPDSLLASFPVGWEDEDPFGRREGVPDWSWGTWLAHLMGGGCSRPQPFRSARRSGSIFWGGWRNSGGRGGGRRKRRDRIGIHLSYGIVAPWRNMRLADRRIQYHR